MVPEYFEPLSSDDCILLTQINLCVAAAGLLLFALLVDSAEHDLRALAFFASAGLIFLARQLDAAVNRLRRLRDADQQRETAEDYVRRR